MSDITLEPLKLLNPAVGASVSNLPLANFSARFLTSLNFRLDIVCSSVTVATGITAKLQHKALGGSYEDLASANASVAITGNGTFSIILHKERAADQADLPLRKSCRLVVTTGAGDSMTVDTISVNQG